MLVASGFFLLEATNMPRKLQNVVEESDPSVQRFIRFNRDIRLFMAINAVMGLVTAVLNMILLMVLGVDFVLLWGMLSFFMSFVPNIGTLIAVIPPAIMTLIQYGIPRTLIVVLGYLLINSLVNNTIKRQYIRSRLKISALVIFLSLILWTWILGPIGAIVAVPIGMLIKTTLASREETSWIAYLMSDGKEQFRIEPEDDPSVIQ